MRPISPAQRKVLAALIEAHPRAATHQFIHAALWPIEADEPECAHVAVRVHIHRLRARLPADAIAAIWTEGYRLEPHAMTAAAKLVSERDARDVEAA